MQVQAFAHSDIGRVRENNQDAYLVGQALGLYVVADGVGGNAAGDVASQLTCQTVQQHLAAGRATLRDYANDPSPGKRQEVVRLIQRAVHAACQRIFRAAQQDDKRQGMASTLALVLIVEQQAIVAHVGDSRVYLVREDKAYQLTEDHSLVAERVKRGDMTRRAAARSPMRNVLTRAIGHQPYVETETLHVELVAGDLFVICTDGLYQYVSPDQLAQAAAQRTPDRLVIDLAEQANRLGGADNITTLVVSIADAPTAATAATIDPVRKLEALRKLPLFEHLTYKELHRVLSIVTVERYEPQQYVIREADPGRNLYVAVTGSFEVVKQGQVIATLGPGSSFGEMALIDASPRSADVIAIEDARVLTIERDDFFDLLRREPELSVKLLWSFCRVLNVRLRDTSAELSYMKGVTTNSNLELPTFLDAAADR